MREKIGEGYVEARVDGTRLGQDVAGIERNLSQRLSAVGKKMRTTGAQLSRRVTLPIVALGAGILKVASDFESGMNRVSALTGVTGDQLDRLRDRAMELGRTTQYSASEAADAMGFLAMAGFETTEIYDAMPGVLQLAAAAQMDIADAADLASNVLTGYGMDVEELGHANDVLAKAFTSANTDLTQLGEAMKYAGPVASGAGIEFEEAAAALALMGNAGIQGTMAGTSLRGAITRLLTPTGEAAALLEELGINATEADGSLRPLDDIVRQLEDSGASTADMMSIFGQRAGPAMMALVNQGADALSDFTGELETSGGTAEQIADKQMEGLSGALARMKSAAEGAAIAVGDTGLLDGMANFAERAAGLFQRLAEANPELLKFGTVAVAAVALAGPVMWAVGAALSALGVLLSPAGLIVGGLLALGAIFVNASGDGETFIERLLDVASDLRERFASAIEWVGDKIQEVGEWFGVTRETVAEEVAGMSTEAVGEIVEMTAGMGDEMAQLVLDGEALSADLADKWLENINRMRDETIAAAEEQHAANVETFTDLALALGSISTQQAEQAIEESDRTRRETIADAELMALGVEAHLQRLQESGVEITEELRAEMVARFEEMRDGTISALVAQEEESINILSRLRGEAGQITLEMAAEAIRNSAVQRDETIAAANTEHEERVASINRMARESDEYTREMADTAIAESRKMRDSTIEAADQQHDGVVTEISGMREDVESEVNLMTGNIISEWDRFYNDHMGRLVRWIVNTETSLISFRFNVLGGIAELVTGMASSFSRGWTSMQRSAASGVNGIIGIVNGMVRAVNRVSSALGLGDIVGELGRVSWGSTPARGRTRGLQEFHGGGIVGRDGRETGGPLKSGDRIIKAKDGEEVLTASDPRHIAHTGDDPREVGGVFGTAKRMAASVRNFGSDLAARVRGLIGKTVQPLVRTLKSRAASRAETMGPIGQIVASVTNRFADRALQWLSGVDAEAKQRQTPSGLGGASLGGSGSVLNRLVAAFRQSGIPGRFTSGYRPGGTSLHGKYRAADFAGPTPSPRPTAAMGRIFDYFAKFGGLSQLIYAGRPWNVLGGRRIPTSSMSAALVRQHRNHVHVGMENGGVIRRPTLGLLGESAKARPEIVTPQRLMADTFRDVLTEDRERRSPSRAPVTIENVNLQRADPFEIAHEIDWIARTVHA